jgi:hypothetical protein
MSKPRTTTASSTNRRNYFRINQDVVFDFRSVDAYQANHGDPAEAFEDASAVGLATELRRIDKSAAQSLKNLADTNPLLGDYLQLLSQKIDLVARHTLLTDKTQENHKRKRINLSEAGIAFNSERAVYKGKFLAVRLIFLPSYVPFMAFAEVIRCQSKTAVSSATGIEQDHHAESFHIAARFHRLPDKDRQELSRQILKAQVADRGAQGGDHKS